MNKQELVRAFAIATVALLGLLLNTAILLAADPIPWTGPVPKANCDRWDWTESGLQGQTTLWERESGDSEGGYNCNLELVGQFRGEGAKSQGGPTYSDDCAYYDTNNDPLQERRGVVVIDASDPRHPRATTYLDDPVMLDPHETLKHNGRRKLLAGAQANGPGFVVYDTSGACTRPVLKGSTELTGSSAHMGNFAPDGLTYYLGQSFRGLGGFMHIVDLSDPSNPKQLPPWQFLGDGRPHGVWLNQAGTRLYAGQPGQFGQPPTNSSFGPDGLVILDVSDYQFRRPNPQVRIISKLFWDDQGQVEEMYPFSANGRQYVISSDESGGSSGVGGLPAACARGASPHGYPNIIDITDERNPKIVAKMMLEVSDPANCELLLNDPPELGQTPQYNQERCVVDRANNPTMAACAFQSAGLRVFDIRDVYRPKEIAYYKPPAMRTAFLPGSASWSPGADRTMDRLAGYPRFVKVPADGTRGRELQIWLVSNDNGFQIVRFTNTFKALQKDLFESD